MEYPQKSIVFEYLTYESVIKMMHTDRDYKTFITKKILFKKFFKDIETVKYEYHYESLGWGNDDYDYDLNSQFHECLCYVFDEFVEDFEELRLRQQQNYKDMENGSTNELMIRVFDFASEYFDYNDIGMYRARFKFDNVCKFIELCNRIV